MLKNAMILSSFQYLKHYKLGQQYTAIFEWLSVVTVIFAGYSFKYLSTQKYVTEECHVNNY